MRMAQIFVAFSEKLNFIGVSNQISLALVTINDVQCLSNVDFLVDNMIALVKLPTKYIHFNFQSLNSRS